MADKKISVKIWLLAACIICMFRPGKVLAAEDKDAATDAAAGMIEVQSGFLDGTGQFQKMKSASGFLIANKESDTYIITNCDTVSNTPGSIKKYCKKNSIKTENMQQFSNYIQIVVKGDVTAQAEVVVKSAEKDYCVLSTANVVSQKEPLKLGDSAGIEANDLVYAYGFPEFSGRSNDTDAQAAQTFVIDAQATQGVVTEKEAGRDGGSYIAHSAPVGQEYAGGPLLDADGYVIGINCKQSPEEDTGIAYALPVNEISAVLDNFSIYYGSRAIDEAYEQLDSEYRNCTKIQQAGGYKKASLQTLQEALTAAERQLQEEEPAAAGLQEAYRTLSAARESLVPKTKALTVTIRILPAVIVLLFIWGLALAVKNAKEKKMMFAPQSQQSQSGMQSGGAQSPGPQSGLYQSPQRLPGGGAQSPQRPQAGSYQNPQRIQPGMPSGGVQPQNEPYRSPSGMQSGPYPSRSGMQNGAYDSRPGIQNAAYGSSPAAQGAAYQRKPAVPPAGRRLRVTRQKTGQAVVVNKNQFVIGKSQTQADFCIADNQTVSRKHVILFENNGSWYIDDLNSLNGTYLNGKKLTAGQAVPVKDGDEILLSDESFLVQG